MEKEAAKRKKNGSITKQMRELSLHSQRDAAAVEIKFRRSDFKGVCRCCPPQTFVGEFCLGRRCREKMKKEFRSSLHRAFSRCLCRKLCIEKIELEMFDFDPKLNWLLEKWIPILVVPDMLLKTLSLCFSQFSSWAPFVVPSAVFQVKSLKKLCLERCSLSQLTGTVVRLECLQTLSLKDVFIEVHALEMLLSSCPLIEDLVLQACDGLTAPNAIRIKHNNLKHLSFSAFLNKFFDPSPSIEIEAPNLLSLSLTDVQLHTNSLENVSSKFPRLEDLSVSCCEVDGGELKLSGRSIKCLALSILTESIKATIDAPNLHDFKFTGESPRASLTFVAPTWRDQWKSHVVLDFLEDFFVHGDFGKLGEVLRALSKSQISLDVCFDNLPTIEEEEEEGEGGFEPVVVENLRLDSIADASPSFPYFLNALFSVCRPRYTQTKNNDNQLLFDFLCKVLVQEREKRDYFWQKDLEHVEVQVFDKKTKEWKPTCQTTSKQDNIRFRLKWSDKEAGKQKTCLLLSSLSLHTI